MSNNRKAGFYRRNVQEQKAKPVPDGVSLVYFSDMERIPKTPLPDNTYPPSETLTPKGNKYKTVGLPVNEVLFKRNKCRHGLRGVQVSIDGQGCYTIESTSWTAGPANLELLIKGDWTVSASRCRLLTDWPRVCC